MSFSKFLYIFLFSFSFLGVSPAWSDFPAGYWVTQISEEDPVLHNFKVLKEYVLDECAGCHDPFNHSKKDHDARTDLHRLMNYRDWIVAGKPEESKLWLRIKDNKSGVQMPLGEPVSKVFVDLIEQWIRQMPLK